MLFTGLGSATAIWLLLCPLLDIETGPRTTLVVAIGLAALVLAQLGVWFRFARWPMAILGSALALICVVEPRSVGSLTNLAICAVALVLAGTTRAPIVAPTSTVVFPDGTVVTVPLHFTTPRAGTTPRVRGEAGTTARA